MAARVTSRRAPVKTPQRLYPLPRAFEALGIQKTAGFALLKQGKLPFVIVGKRRMVPADAIAKIVEHGTQDTAA
jgi:hypothetical protein